MHRRVLVLSLLLASSACVRNPVSGHRQLSLLSQKDEIALGQQSAKEVEQTIGVVKDAALNQYVSSVGMSMARHSERPDLPWSFQVVDDPSVNAFALPGGPIFATRGLLASVNSEAELAGVLGHEIGHVTARHTAAQVTRTELAQLGLGVGAVISPTVAQYGQIAAAGMQLLFLKYSRGDESQADELGFRYMRQAGYDPRKMADLFVTLQRVSEAEGGEGKLPTWLSTHPDPGDRLEKARERVAQLKGVDFSQLKVNEAGYLSHLQGLVYGENPRQGFFRGSLFLHPDLRFQLQFPEGWKTQNQPQSVAAQSPQQDAVVGLAPAPGVTPEQGLQKFLSQQGLHALSASTSGVPGSAGYFEAQTEQGVVRGLTTFITHGGSTFQLVGYTVAEKLPTYDGAFRATFGSFHELTDPAALAVQPAHLELVTLEQPLTVEQFQARYPSTVPLKEVALINGVDVGGTLPTNRPVKRVVGGVGAAGKP